MSAADQAGLTSVLASPLYARGELLGVISLALSRLTDRPDPHYDLSDGDLIGAIASRVAVAIDNAMLFEAERRTALAFQQSPAAAGRCRNSTGSRSRSATCPPSRSATQGQGIQTQVGGDWYDIIPLAAGRVGLVIGDVEGRGAAGRGDHGPAPRRAARLRPGREVARRHHAQAGRVGPVHRAGRRRRRPADRSAAST